MRGNTELDLFSIWYQSYSRTHKTNYINCSEQTQIIDTVEGKIVISQNMVEFEPPKSKKKLLNGASLVNSSSVVTKNNIIIQPSGSIPPALATSI